MSSEEFIAGDGMQSGTYVDFTAKASNGNTIRVQTIDTLADGLTPTAREAAAARRITAAFPNDELILIPKRAP